MTTNRSTDRAVHHWRGLIQALALIAAFAGYVWWLKH